MIHNRMNTSLLRNLIPETNNLPLNFTLLIRVVRRRQGMSSTKTIQLPNNTPRRIRRNTRTTNPLRQTMRRSQIIQLRRQTRVPLRRTLRLNRRHHQRTTTSRLQNRVPHLLGCTTPQPRRRCTTKISRRQDVSPPRHTTTTNRRRSTTNLLVLLRTMLTLNRPRLRHRHLYVRFVTFHSR